MDFRFPSINGQTSQEQIGQMKSYIYQLVEQLNFAFSSLENSNYEIVDTIVKANGKEGNSTDRQSKFNQLKDLIIKTAAIVNAYEEVWIKEFKGSYTADSDFGKYSRQTLNQITANSTNITAAFTKLSKITNPDGTGILDNIEAYIKAGELDTDIYGVEIGETNNGSFTHFARFTASRLSFYDGNGSEVAYVSNNKIFINKAQFNDVVSIGNDSGGELNVYNGKINVYVGTGNNQRRVLYADNDGNLVLSGTINAEKGQIAGFNIDGDTLYGEQVGMDAVSGGDYAFWAGAAKGNSANAPFRVGHAGELYATQATISGNSTFTGTIHAGSGQIGGWDISGGRLETVQSGVGRIRINSTSSDRTGNWIEVTTSNWESGSMPFYVTRGGVLHATEAVISGTITATSGSFTGTIQAGSIISDGAKFGASGYTTMTDRYDDNHPGDSNYAGTLWHHTNSNNWIWLNIDGLTTNCSLNVGGTINIGSGAISSYWSSTANHHFKLNTNYNYLDLCVADDIKLWCRPDKSRLKGTWESESSISIVSDINQKNTVNNISEEYCQMFDNLKPVTYKYNNGTSDRLHTGFVAQDVNNALAIAGISTQNFAGLVVSDKGTSDELWTLRYEEFIALNTWQIQKAKARITELENTVSELTTKMTELESRLSAIESTLS